MQKLLTLCKKDSRKFGTLYYLLYVWRHEETAQAFE